MIKLFTNREQIRLLNSKSTDLDWYYFKHNWKLKLLIRNLLFTTCENLPWSLKSLKYKEAQNNLAGNRNSIKYQVVKALPGGSLEHEQVRGRYFCVPTASECKKFKRILLQQVGFKCPHPIEWHSTICRSLLPPKTLAQKGDSLRVTSKVTLCPSHR